MDVVLGVVSAAGLLIALYGLSGEEGERLTRRAWARLAILAATGLSFLPGCGGERPPPKEPDDYEPPPTKEPDGYEPPPTLLGKWGCLGRIWRDLSTHLRGQWSDRGEQRDALVRLRSRMDATLDALPAWPELRAVFEARYEHIERILSGLPCYLPLPPGCYPQPQFRVEDQVEQLEKLVAEGRLSERAARRAAGVLAIPAEYLVQAGEIRRLPYEEWHPALDELRERYCNGTLEAGPAAELAGERLVELTVDDLGWLAGPPQENEGFTESTVGAETGEEEAD